MPQNEKLKGKGNRTNHPPWNEEQKAKAREYGRMTSGNRTNHPPYSQRALTERQEKFCLYYIASNDAKDAYTKAGYPFKAGNIRSEQALGTIPYRMLANDRIKYRIKQLTAKGGLKTKEDLLKFLGFTIDAVAEGPPRVSDQVRATEIYARLEGHFEPSKVELGLSEGFTAYLRELRASELGSRGNGVMTQRYDSGLETKAIEGAIVDTQRVNPEG